MQLTRMRKEDCLKEFKDILVIDPQEDCHCPIERYNAEIDTTYIWLKDGKPDSISFGHSYVTTLPVPMSIESIGYEQFKECLIASLPYAVAVNNVNDFSYERYSRLLINKNFNSNLLSNEWKNILVDYFIRPNLIITLSEIPENYIYFLPDPEFLGCFTWNLSRHGMFIMANKIGVHVI